MLDTPVRTVKPRKTGITAVNDTRLSTGELANVLEDYGIFLDVAKLGVGVAYILPNLDAKIELYRKHDIQVYFGGTLFEKFYAQNKFNEYLDFLRKHKIDMLEIST